MSLEILLSNFDERAKELARLVKLGPVIVKTGSIFSPLFSPIKEQYKTALNAVRVTIDAISQHINETTKQLQIGHITNSEILQTSKSAFSQAVSRVDQAVVGIITTNEPNEHSRQHFDHKALKTYADSLTQVMTTNFLPYFMKSIGEKMPPTPVAESKSDFFVKTLFGMTSKKLASTSINSGNGDLHKAVVNSKSYGSM